MISARTDLLVRAKTLAQFAVDDIEAPRLSDDDEHHLRRVLRARSGETVCLIDGRGAWRTMSLGDAGLVAVGDIQYRPMVEPVIEVAFALTKGDKPELVVQKLTEIGVDVIVPLFSHRTVVRWDETKARQNVERMRRVAHEATMQSRRLYVPEVKPAVAFEHYAQSVSVHLAHPGGELLTLDGASVAVGPEGGWTDEELASASALVDLGPNVLRAETAAITVAMQLCDQRNRQRSS